MRIPGTYGKTLLHVAARRNLAGLCRCLLRVGADVNRADILDRTALHFAVQNGAEDAARLLITHGAELHAKDWQGRTPLELANQEDCKAIEAIIRDKISLRGGRRIKRLKVMINRD